MKAGWEVKTLGDVCDFKGGSQPPKSQFIHEPQPGYVRMLQIRDFKTDNKAVYIPITDKTNQCAETDIMIGRYGASVGQIHRGKSGAYNVALIRTIPDKKYIDQDYLYHYLTSDLFQKPLMSVSKRGAQDGFSKPDIAPFQIPLPPLEEQKRIVSILDEAFEGLDRARENAEANLKSARELFENYRETYFKIKKRSVWSMVKLENLIEVKHGFAFKSTFFTDSGKYAVLTPGNYHETGGFKDRGKKQRYYDGDFPNEFKLDKDDLLMAMTEQAPGLLGSCLIVPQNDGYLHNQRLGLITPKDGVSWSAAYFAQAFNLKSFRKGLSDSCSGATVRHTSPKRILAESIPYCDDVSELNLAAEHITSLESECKKLGIKHQAKLEDISDLRQSLLQKAFAGELT